MKRSQSEQNKSVITEHVDRTSHHWLGGGDSYWPGIWSDNTVDHGGCQNPTGRPRRREQTRGPSCSPTYFTKTTSSFLAATL